MYVSVIFPYFGFFEKDLLMCTKLIISVAYLGH
jgi:hypothetical protein